MFCGINPGRLSAEAGVHFANPRNDFWRLLHEAGFPQAGNPGHKESIQTTDQKNLDLDEKQPDTVPCQSCQSESGRTHLLEPTVAVERCQQQCHFDPRGQDLD